MFRIIGPKAQGFVRCSPAAQPARHAPRRRRRHARPVARLAAEAAGGRRPGADAAAIGGGPGWGKAKSVIMVYLQGGPSHLDLWDPKPNACRKRPQRRSRTSARRCPACSFTEILPKLAQVNDQFTMIRSMSYTPNGLFNHTAAIYQMMTGYTTDKVSPSGQLEPPNAQGLPELRLADRPAEAADRADAAVRDAAAAAAGEQRRRQGRLGRLPGQGLRSVHALPRRRRHGHEQDGPHQGRRPQAAARGVRRPARAPRQAARR